MKKNLIAYIVFYAVIITINVLTNTSPWSGIPIIVVSGFLGAEYLYKHRIALIYFELAVVLTLLVYINLVYSPSYLWFIYTAPVMLFLTPSLERRRANWRPAAFAILYVLINIYYEDRYPFSIFVVIFTLYYYFMKIKVFVTYRSFRFYVSVGFIVFTIEISDYYDNSSYDYVNHVYFVLLVVMLLRLFVKKIMRIKAI
jgi:hypothetical protein